MTEALCWADKNGFKTGKEYVDYMPEYGLWGSDEHIKLKGTLDKMLVKKQDG
jgi:hypothetical protein